MTKKSKEFARLVASGMKPGDAYKIAYEHPDMDGVSASKHASRLMKKDEVSRRVDRVDRLMDRSAIMSKQARMKWLSKRVKEVGSDAEPPVVANAIRCIAELNKMDGAYEPERVEAKVEARGFAAVMAAVMRKSTKDE